LEDRGGDVEDLVRKEDVGALGGGIDWRNRATDRENWTACRKTAHTV